MVYEREQFCKRNAPTTINTCALKRKTDFWQSIRSGAKTGSYFVEVTDLKCSGILRGDNAVGAISTGKQKRGL